MASPKTLELREEMAGLHPTRIYLDRPRTPKQSLPGEFKALLRQSAALARRQNRARRAATTARDDQARGFQRTIPTSGPGRRRAKALRNKQAVEDAEFRLALMSAQLGAACLNE